MKGGVRVVSGQLSADMKKQALGEKHVGDMEKGKKTVKFLYSRDGHRAEKTVKDTR